MASFMRKAVFREQQEEELIGQFLPPRGFFVEIGAYHPTYASQTFQLEQRGWDGLLIEPVPAHAEQLRMHRTARVVQTACGSPEQHGTSFPLYVAGGMSSLRFHRGPPIIVPVVTLDSVLSEANVSRIDFLSVDVEGVEIDVLRGFSFERYRPDFILLEDFAEDLSKHRFMRSKGYKRVRRTGNNSWYLPEDVAFPIPLYGRLQILRKYYLSIPTRLARYWLKKHFQTPKQN
jgi:FkbM family methyltransferase